MRPELVVNAQQTIDAFIKSNLSVRFDDSEYLSDLVYDLSLPLAVYEYHVQDQSAHEDFTSFFTSYLSNVFKTYPIFANLSNHVEMLNSYFNNFPKLDNIQILGDVHLACTKFKHKDLILYLNAFGYEEVFRKLSAEFDEFFYIFPQFDIHKNYVARHYVEAQNDNVNLEKFYFNIGKFFTYAMFFRMIDLHQENVIIRDNEHLFSFDIESTFTPEYESAPYGLKVTGLVSGQTDDNNSALFGGMFKINSYLKPIFGGTERDPQITWQTTSRRKFLNMPKITEASIHPNLYYKQIEQGVLYALDYLVKNKPQIVDTITQSEDFKFRLITRPTRVYKYILYEFAYRQKEFNSNEDVKNYLANLLNEANQLKCGQYYTTMLEHEIEELQKLSIPISLCSFNTKNIYTADHKVVGQLNKSPKECFLLHANNFEKFMKTELLELHEIILSNYNSTKQKV